MARLFLSYRREDTAAYTHILYSQLQSRFPLGEVFMDVRSVRPGQDFVEAIVQTVRSCDVMIAVIGRRWQGEGRRGASSLLHDEKDFVRLELQTAVEAGLHIVPVLVGGGDMPTAEDLPDSLQRFRRLNAFVVTDSRLDEDAGRLARSLEEILVTEKAPTLRRRMLAGTGVAIVVGAAGLWWAIDPQGEPRPSEQGAVQNNLPVTQPSQQPTDDAPQRDVVSTLPSGGARPDPPSGTRPHGAGATSTQPQEPSDQTSPTTKPLEAETPYVLARQFEVPRHSNDNYNAGVWNLAFSFDGRWLATAEGHAESWYDYQQGRGVVRVRSVESGAVALELAASGDRRCNAVAFVDNDRVVTVCEGGTPGAGSQMVRIWARSGARLLRTLLTIDPVDGNGMMRFVDYDRTQRRIVATGGSGRSDYKSPDESTFATFRTWAADTGELDVALSLPDFARDAQPALSPDGRWVAVPGHRGLELRRVGDGTTIRQFSEIELGVDALAFSPEGDRLLAAVSRDPGEQSLLLVVDTETGAIIRSFPLRGEVRWLAALRNDLAMIPTSDGLHIMRVSDAAIVQQIAAGSSWPRTIAVTPERRLFAVTTGEGTIDVYREREPAR